MPSATPTSAEIAASIEHAEFGQFGKGVEAVTFLTASLIRAGAVGPPAHAGAGGSNRATNLAQREVARRRVWRRPARVRDKLRRPDVEVAGIDVLVRSHTHVAVAPFDGRDIPHGDGAFESVMMVDVLHHTDDPVVLLREAARVARREVILKDHTMNTRLSGSILRFMDDVGNERHGVNIVYNYWPTERWRTAFSQLQLEVADWIPDPALYPWPASLVFGRGLHFVARLTRRGAA
jgi:SAM-dependent methyltransferase